MQHSTKLRLTILAQPERQVMGWKRFPMILLCVLFLSTFCASPKLAHAGFNGGVGMFLPVSPLSKDVLNYWVIPKTKLAKSYGLQFVNLIVHWKDLEPSDNSFNFQPLADFVKAIKAQGLQCVVRIYFNGGSWIQSAPSWLFDSKRAAYYLEGSYRQPVPWDQTYLDQMTQFMLQLGLWFKNSPTSLPDALQISAGGIYGEEAVLGIDWQATFGSDGYDAYYFKLMAAQKRHVNVFNTVAGYLNNLDCILMIAHLYDNNPEMDDMLMQHSINLDVKWFQTNSWSGELLAEWYGQWVMAMFDRHRENNHFYLEDEFGSKTSVPIKNRLDNIKLLRSTYAIKFDAVSISLDDLTSSNATAIGDLVKYVRSSS
jgi:hypothetical protein